jgi:hypothetical protein
MAGQCGYRVKIADENKSEIYKAFENRDEITVVDKQYLTGNLLIIRADFSRIASCLQFLCSILLLRPYRT